MDRSSRFCKFHLNVFLHTIPNELSILLRNAYPTIAVPIIRKTPDLFYPDLAIATSPQLHSSFWRRVQHLFASVALGNVCRTLASLWPLLGIYRRLDTNPRLCSFIFACHDSVIRFAVAPKEQPFLSWKQTMRMKPSSSTWTGKNPSPLPFVLHQSHTFALFVNWK